MNVFVFVGAVLLYAAWGALVLLGKVDAHEYVAAITGGLAWLAAHATAKSAAASAAAAEPAPVSAVASPDEAAH